MGRDRVALIGTRRSPLRFVVAAVPFVFLGVLFIWPLVEVVTRSLIGVGISDVSDRLARPSVRRVLWFTAGQALVSVVATLVIGLPIAHALATYRFRGRSLVRAFVVVPFVLPTLVVAASFDALFKATGLDRGRVDLDQSMVAIIAAHVFFNVSIIIRVVGGFWSTLDRRSLEAARLLGASPRVAFRTVTLPRLVPVIAGAASMVFLFSFTSFGIILILGGPRRATLETEIYRYAVFRQEFDTAAILALLQLVIVAALAFASARLQRQFSVGERRRSAAIGLSVDTPARRRHLLAILALIGVVVGAPVLALIERSLSFGDGYGFGHFRSLVGDTPLLPTSPFNALWTSIQFALLAAVIAVIVGMITARVVVAGGLLGRSLEAIALIPLGTSAVTLGFGYLLAFTAFDLRQSAWLVPVAHSVIGLPFVLGAVVPAMRSIDPRLRDAASMLGASPLRVWIEVEWPLIRRALLTGAGFVVAVSLGEFGATSFLSRGENSFTAPLAIFRLLSQPGSGLRGQAMALSVVIGALVAGLALLLERRRSDGPTLL